MGNRIRVALYNLEDMSISDIIETLEGIKFTAARNWRRSIWIGPGSKKLLIEALKLKLEHKNVRQE